MLCPVCRSGPAGCLSTCTLCKECWRVPEECDCSSRDISTAAPTQQKASMSGGNMKEPAIYPSASIQGDRKKLANKEDGVNQIIKYMEEKFGVSQHSEIDRKLNDFYS